MPYCVQFYRIEKTKYNPSTRRFEDCKPFLYNACGSDYSMIIDDLKTIRGVVNRVRKIKHTNEIVHFKVFTYTNFYNEDTFKEVYSENIRAYNLS